MKPMNPRLQWMAILHLQEACNIHVHTGPYRIATMAWSEASISSVIGRLGIQWQRIGAEENASFRQLKADFSVSLKLQGTDF